MGRNRVIYQSEALYCGGTGDTSLTVGSNQIGRVQSANYSFDIARTDVNQFGQLAAIDRIILEQPTVSLDFSYLVTTGAAETIIGLDVGANSAISSILSGDDLTTRKDVQNYYIYTASEGNDAVGSTAGNAGDSVIAIGNGFLSSYSVEGGVGEFVTANVSVEALNMAFHNQTISTVPNPTVNPVDGAALNAGTEVTIPNASAVTGSTTPSALRPGDVVVTIPDASVKGFDDADLKVQNFSISFDLSRTNLEKLGSKFAFSKEIEFPAQASCDFSAILGDTEAAKNDDALIDILTTDTAHTVIVNCVGYDSTVGVKYSLLGGKVDNYSISSSIGDNKSLDMTFTSQIGGPQDTSNGIKIEATT